MQLHQEATRQAQEEVVSESVSVVRFSWLTSGQIVLSISFGPLQPAVVDICFAFLFIWKIILQTFLMYMRV